MKGTRLAIVAFCVLTLIAYKGGGSRFPPEEEQRQETVKLSHGLLAYDFYSRSCPKAQEIVDEYVSNAVSKKPGQAPGLLRIMFHDCFVLGCDASILLQSGPEDEIEALPNVDSLRTESMRLIDEIKSALEDNCPGIVSCADIIAMATTTAIKKSGGPCVTFPMGRRDRPVFGNNNTVVAALPDPSLNFSGLVERFNKVGLGIEDLVALSGGHTFGRSRCILVRRTTLQRPTAELDPSFAELVENKCNRTGIVHVHLDFVTPKSFDNSYYKNILDRRVLFHSDSELLKNKRAKSLVQAYASDKAMFFKQFSISMIKLSRFNVLTGNEGEIRRICTEPGHG